MAATVEEFDLRITIPGLQGVHRLLHRLSGRFDDMAVDQATLDADIQALKASVDALVAIVQNPAPAPAIDLQPQADAVAAIKAEADAAVAAATPAA